MSKEFIIYENWKNIIFQQVYFEITNKCNIKCNYCFNNSIINGSKLIDKKFILEIISQVKLKNNSKIYLSGGEPLLHPNLDNIVRDIFKMYKGQIIILSNGLMINKKNIEKINERVNWQIGSGLLSTRNLFEQNWEIYKNKLNILLEKYKGSTITLAYTITMQNIGFLDEFINEFINIPNVKFLLSFVQKRGRAEHIWNEINIPVSIKLSIIEKYKNKFCKIEFCGTSLDEDLCKILNKDGHFHFMCEKAVEMYVDYNKNIRYCQKLDNCSICNKCNEKNMQDGKLLIVNNCLNNDCSSYKRCAASCIECMEEGGLFCQLK